MSLPINVMLTMQAHYILQNIVIAIKIHVNKNTKNDIDMKYTVIVSRNDFLIYIYYVSILQLLSAKINAGHVNIISVDGIIQLFYNTH